jgi:DNA polymerase-1
MNILAFDTETKGLDWFDPDQQAFMATWADADGEYSADLSDPAEVGRFTAAIEAADVIVCHNLSFDANQTFATLGIDVLDGKVVHDTDLLSRVLYPEGQRAGERGGHGLKNLAKVHLRADADGPEEAIKEMAKAIGLRTLKQTGAYYEVYRAYPDVMTEYAVMDARYTYDLFTKFLPQLGDLRRVYELEMAVAPVIIRAEQRGVQTDQVACRQLKEQYTAELEQVHEYLLDTLGESALGGAGSEQALIEALLEAGIPLHRKTPTGQLATNIFALQEFEDDYEVVGKLSEHRRLEKFLSTYIGALEGRDVVHPSFRQAAAWTGRMSCTRPNLQNIPKRAGKEVRSVLVPRPGHSFVVCDYESIEVRLLAYYLGDDDYRELVANSDPHAWMATHLHGGTIDMYLKGTPGEDLRAQAKNTLFAIVYGAGAPRVSDMNKIGLEEARDLIAKIKSALPGFRRLQQRVRNKIETVGHVNTIYGRKQVVNRDKAYVGLNALIQGSAADIFKLGVVNVERAVKPLGGVPLLFVHDEIVVEVPTEHADECLRATEHALISAHELSPRLAVSGSVVHTSYAAA